MPCPAQDAPRRPNFVVRCASILAATCRDTVMRTMSGRPITLVVAAMAAILSASGLPLHAQDSVPDAAAEQAPPPASESAAAPSAIPKPAPGEAAPKPARKTAKKGKVSCEGLFEAACKEASGCAWSGGLAKADGSQPTAECVKVDKATAKGTKDSCPAMFEALCKETAGCAWSPGTAAAENQPATSGSCTYEGKAKKKTADKSAPAAPKEPAPDAFTDQSAQ